MPYKREDSPIYWASYTDPGGKRVRRSTGATDRKEAVAIEAKWKLEAHQERQWGREPDRSIEEVMLAFLTAHADRRSIETSKYHARDWRRILPGMTFQAMRPVDVQGYIVQRRSEGVCNSSINRELATLQAALNWCNKALGWNLPNPIRGRFLPEPEGRLRWLKPEEAGRLIDAALMQKDRPYLADVIRLAINTGMRRGEILGLEWNRVDLQRRVITLEAEHTKTKRRRTVPLNDTAHAALINRARFRASHCPGSPWVCCDNQGTRLATVRRSFDTACRLAGIEDFHFHDLRHTCAAWLVTSGAPLAEVRDLLGHASVTMTERYAHLAPENVRAAVNRLDGLSRSGHAGPSNEPGQMARKA